MGGQVVAAVPEPEAGGIEPCASGVLAQTDAERIIARLNDTTGEKVKETANYTMKKRGGWQYDHENRVFLLPLQGERRSEVAQVGRSLRADGMFEFRLNPGSGYSTITVHISQAEAIAWFNKQSQNLEPTGKAATGRG